MQHQLIYQMFLYTIDTTKLLTMNERAWYSFGSHAVSGEIHQPCVIIIILFTFYYAKNIKWSTPQGQTTTSYFMAILLQKSLTQHDIMIFCQIKTVSTHTPEASIHSPTPIPMSNHQVPQIAISQKQRLFVDSWASLHTYSL